MLPHLLAVLKREMYIENIKPQSYEEALKYLMWAEFEAFSIAERWYIDEDGLHLVYEELAGSGYPELIEALLSIKEGLSDLNYSLKVYLIKGRLELVIKRREKNESD